MFQLYTSFLLLCLCELGMDFIFASSLVYCCFCVLFTVCWEMSSYDLYHC